MPNPPIPSQSPTPPSPPPPAPPVPPVTPPEPPIISPQPPQKKSFTWLIILVILFLLASTGVLAYQYYQLKTQTINSTPSSSPVAVNPSLAPFPTPTPSQDPTADWKTYTNSVDNFSFKYSSTWIIDTQGEKGDERQENIQVKLTKDKAIIGITANLVGIGGGPRNVPFEEINLWGKTYYKQFSDIDFTTNTKRIDISDDPRGLGVFKIGTQTYMISLTYPADQEGDKPDELLSEEFDQILSTFKFTN